jgi:hypothetical protein
MIPGLQLAQDLGREWNRCAAESVPLTLLAVSLDHPEAGDHDEALTHLDRALRVHCARDRNRVTRRDNGIFIAFLPATAPNAPSTPPKLKAATAAPADRPRLLRRVERSLNCATSGPKPRRVHPAHRN